MIIFTSLYDINWTSVIVATVLAFAIGGLWYSPVLFGKTWQEEINFNEDRRKKVNMPAIFGLAFLLNFISAIFLDAFIGVDSNLWKGLITAIIISVFFISSALGITYLFSQRSLKLFLIDAGYFITYYSIMGAILGAWK